MMDLQPVGWEDVRAFALQHGQSLPARWEKPRAIAFYDQAIVAFSQQGFQVGPAYLNAVRLFEVAGDLQFRHRAGFRINGWNTDSTFDLKVVDENGQIISDLLDLGHRMTGEHLAPVGYGSLNLEHYLGLNPTLTPFAYGLEVYDAFMDSQSAIYSLHGQGGEHVLRRWGHNALDSLKRFLEGNMLWVLDPYSHTFYG